MRFVNLLVSGYLASTQFTHHCPRCHGHFLRLIEPASLNRLNFCGTGSKEDLSRIPELNRVQLQ